MLSFIQFFITVQSQKMKKTSKQPQFKPIIQIKIPKTIEDRDSQKIYEFIKSNPVLTKKDLIRNNPQTKKKQQSQRVKNDEIVIARTQLHTSNQSRNCKIFKIKTLGAGFRRFSSSESKRVESILKKSESKAEIREYLSVRLKRQNEKSQEKVKEKERKEDIILYKQRLNKLNKPKESKIAKTESKIPKSYQSLQIFQQPILNHSINSQNYDFTDSSSNQQFQDAKIFAQIGFGVSHSLCSYDLQSLEDPNGNIFLTHYLGKKIKCPKFQGKLYKWVDAVVEGFNTNSKKAIIKLLKSNQYVEVGRMSIKLEKQEKYFWRRINKAKKLRRQIRQQLKYLRYVDSRNQTFQCRFQYFSRLEPNYLQLIQKQCFNRFCKQFLIYNEMHKNPQFYKLKGIQIRKYQPFIQKVNYPPYQRYKQYSQKVRKNHYSIVKSLPISLMSIRNRLSIENVITFVKPTNPVGLSELKQLTALQIQKTIVRTLKIRQLIVSQTFYYLRDCFEKKSDEQRYFKLHNYIFRQTLIQNLYYENCKSFLNFLKNFTLITKDTPSPIVLLDVVINNQTKCIQCVPSPEEVYQCLLNPLNLLEIKFKQIDDLMSDLTFSKPKYLNIVQSVQKQTIIKHTIQYSYQNINHYIKQMNRHSKYLDKLQFRKDKFSFEALTIYQNIAIQIEQNLKHILHSTLTKSGIFRVNLKPFKDSLTNCMIKHRTRILKVIQKQVVQEFTEKITQFLEVLEKLQSRPIDQDQLVAMRHYINQDCDIFYQNSKQHYKLCVEFYYFLQRRFYAYSQKEYEKMFSVTRLQNKLLQKMNQKINQLFQIQREFIEKINAQRQQIFKGMDDCKIRIAKVQVFHSYDQYQPNYKQTSHVYDQLTQYQASLKSINYRQTLLGQQLSNFPLLHRLKKSIQPFYDLWHNTFWFSVDCLDWNTQSIISLNYIIIEQKINEVYGKQFMRLGKLFVSLKNATAAMISDSGLQKVQRIKQKLWIIDSFTKQGLLKKTNMMKDIVNNLSESNDQLIIQTMSLNQLIKRGADKNRTFIEQSAAKAQKLWKLEKICNQVVVETKQLTFNIDKVDETYHIEIINVQQLQSAISEQIEIIEMVRCEQESSMILKKVNTIHSKLQVIQSTLIRIQQFEGMFFKIRKIMKINEIGLQMPKQKSKLTEVQKSWNSIILHFLKDIQIWECIDSQSYRGRLQNYEKILHQIYLNIKVYLNTKRILFPRLFFINDQSLIKLLLQQDQQDINLTLQRYFFYGLNKYIKRQGMILGIQGNYGQIIKFSKGIKNSIILWDKLKLIHESIKQSVKNQITIGIKRKDNLFINQLTVQLCQWTKQCQQHISKSELRKYYSKYIDKINKTQKTDIKSYFLLQRQICLRDTINTLLQLNVTDIYHYQWLSSFRYYRTDQGINLSSAIFLTPFGLDYSGITQSVGFINQLKTNLHLIMSLRSMNMIGLTKNNFNTLKILSLEVLNHYAEVQCPQTPQICDMILKGTILGNVWCLINNYSQITTETASALANTLWQVQNAIRSKKTIVSHYQQLKIPNNYSLSIIFQTNKKTYQINNLMRVLWRQITFITPLWTQVISLQLQSRMLQNQYSMKILKKIQILQINIDQEWYHNYRNRLVDTTYAQIPIQNWKNQEIVYNALLKTIDSQFSNQQLTTYKHLANEQLKQGIDIINKTDIIKFCILNNHPLLLIGQPLSGKTELIFKAFKELNLQYPQIIRRIDTHCVKEKWKIIDGIDFSSKDMFQDKTIIESITTSEVDPCLISSMRVLYNNYEATPLNIVKKFLTNIKVQHQAYFDMEEIIQTMITKYGQQMSKSNKIRLTIYIIKMIECWVKKGLIPNHKIHAKQLRFMLILAVYSTFSNNSLDPKHFYSNFANRNSPLNFYYSVEKSAWLEWVTFDLHPAFKISPPQFLDIYVPIKESIYTLYFSSVLHRDQYLMIISQKNGIGRTTLIKTLQSNFQGIHEKVTINKKWKWSKLKNMLQTQMGSRIPGSINCPSNNKTLLISIQDLHLVDYQDPIQDFRELIDRNTSTSFNKKYSNFRLLFSKLSSHCSVNIENRLMRYCIPILLRQPDQESLRHIFDYFFQWFFSNTQNPFSKQVRQMTSTMINSTVYIYKIIKKKGKNECIANFRSVIKVLQGISKSSPKTVKNSKDILDLWGYQMRNVFENTVNGFNQILQQSINQNKIHIKLSHQIIFSKINCQTYQQIPKATIFKYLQKMSNQGKFGNNIIVFNTLVHQVIKIIRILLTPKGNMLIVGPKSTSKKTAVKIASFIVFSQTPSIITNNSLVWQQDIIKAISTQYDRPSTILFDYDSRNQQEEYLDVVCQLLQTNQLRSYLFDKKYKYLDKISINSFNTPKYYQYAQKCRNNIHYVVCMDLTHTQIINSYPSLINCMAVVNNVCNWTNDCFLEVAKIMIGSFYSQFNQCLQMYMELRKEQFEINEGIYVKWMIRSKQIYEQSVKRIRQQQQFIIKGINKVDLTIKQKQQFEWQLKRLKNNLQTLSQQNNGLLDELTIIKRQYQAIFEVYLSNKEIYEKQAERVRKLQKQCQEQLSGVLPLLKEAEQALQKVTRDDINQLRSFPNPPLPAVKVVQALCFVFNEDHLVKEKVLQSGQKIRDFWQYSKKFILNDKLLKRVSEFKPDLIKELPRNKIMELKEIIKKKQFEKEKVFKASIAAGNLSLWIRAVIATFEVMEVIDPKRKAVNSARQALQQQYQVLKAEQGKVNEYEQYLKGKEQNYDSCMNNERQLSDKIEKLEKLIQNSNKFLYFLKIQQKEWFRYKQDEISRKRKQIKMQSVLSGLFLIYGVGCPPFQKSILKQKIKTIFTKNVINSFNLVNTQSLKDVKTQFQEYKCAAVEQNLQNLRALFIQLTKKQLLVIFDETKTYLNCIKKLCSSLIIIDSLNYNNISSLINNIQMNHQSDQTNQIQQQTQDSNLVVIVIINIEYHHDISKQSKILQNWAQKYHQYHVIVIFSQKTQNIHNFNQITIYNSCTPNSKNYLLKQALFGIKKQYDEWNHQKSIQNAKQQLIDILCKLENILIHEQLVEKWKDCFDKMKQLESTKLKVKKCSIMEQQLVNKVKQMNLWTQFQYFPSYLERIKSMVIPDEVPWNIDEQLKQFYINLQKDSKLILMNCKGQKSQFIWMFNKNAKIIHEDIQQIILNQQIGFLPIYDLRHLNQKVNKMIQIYKSYQHKSQEDDTELKFQAYILLYTDQFIKYQGFRNIKYCNDQIMEFINKDQIKNEKNISEYQIWHQKRIFQKANSNNSSILNKYGLKKVLMEFQLIKIQQQLDLANNLIKIRNLLQQLQKQNKTIKSVKEITDKDTQNNNQTIQIRNYNVIFNITSLEKQQNDKNPYQILSEIQHFIIKQI